MSDVFVPALHITAASVALVTGAAVLALRKGTSVHKAMGYVYVTSMLVLNAAVLWIFHMSGKFGPFHWAALVSLGTLVVAFVPVLLRRPAGKWLELHLEYMAWSYVGLLAAAVAESAVRLPSSPFWPTVVGGTVAVWALGGLALSKKKQEWLAGGNRAV